MLLFKRPLLFLILQKRKTQTRRLARSELSVGRIYGINDRYSKPKAYVRITRKYRQRLADITLAEAVKEGFNNVEELRAFWHANIGDWNPEQTVICYEFKLVQ